VIVADKIAEWLEQKAITHSFGIIGGGNVVLWDAINRRGYTKLVCVHHEQAAAMAAAYYYRTSGRLSLCLVTTGAGSSNVITGVLAAYMDRVPLLVISGNEASYHMEKKTRVWGVQGYGSVEVADGITKWSMRMGMEFPVSAQLSAMRRIAMEPPFGPVWFDIPKDIQGAMA